jgi:hypothetical protein
MCSEADDTVVVVGIEESMRLGLEPIPESPTLLELGPINDVEVSVAD